MKKTIQFPILLVIALFTSPLMWAQTVVTPSALSTSNGYITYTNSGIDGIDVPPNALLNFQGDFSISLKVKFDDVTFWNMLFSYENYGGLEFSYYGGLPYGGPPHLIFTTDGSTAHVTHLATWYPVNQVWYQVVLTKSGNVFTTYIDGSLLLTSSSPYAIPNFSSQHLRIGNYGQGLYFKGTMDEVSIWNIALSQSYISNTLTNPLNGNESGLLLYYDMDTIGAGAGLTVRNKAVGTGSALNGLTFGTASTPYFTQVIPVADADNDGFTIAQGDCNDSNANINPAATEICNNLDDDCDGYIDEGFAPVPGAINGTAVQCLTASSGTAIFTVAPVPGAVSYAWTVPGAVIITAGQGTTSITIGWTSAAAQAGINGALCFNAIGTCGTGQSCVKLDLQIAKPVQSNSISGPAKVCPGDQVTYSVSSVARATGYIWTVPSGISIATGQGSNIITATVGASFTSGSVTVSATNACGVGPIRSRIINLNPPLMPGSITGSSNGICNVTGATYSIAAVAGASSYLWSINNGGTIIGSNSGTSAIVDWNAFTNAIVSVASVNGCGTSVARTLNVNAAPAQPGTITGASTGCTSGTNHYSIATVTGAANYSWDFSSTYSIIGQGTKDVDITFGALPAYNQVVRVQATNLCGISSIRSSPVFIASCSRIVDTTSDFTAQAFNIFPNPAHDQLNVLFNTAKGTNYTLLLFDITGNLVLSKTGVAAETETQLNIDIHQLSKGMYFAQLKTENGASQIKVVAE